MVLLCQSIDAFVKTAENSVRNIKTAYFSLHKNQ